MDIDKLSIGPPELMDYRVKVLGKYYTVYSASYSKIKDIALDFFYSDPSNKEDSETYPKKFIRSTIKVALKGESSSLDPVVLICMRCGEPLGTRSASARFCKKCRHLKSDTKSSGNGPAVGSERTLPSGYKSVLAVSGKWRLQHKVVMEKTLGRKLRKGEAVHHINAARADNRPGNLELWVRTHPSGARARDLNCPYCGKSYFGTVPDYLSLGSRGGISIGYLPTGNNITNT